MNPPESSLQSYLSYSLAAAFRHVHVDLNSKLKTLGVQIETWRVLQSLQSDNQYTMSELAEIVLMNPPTLTKLIDRMVADGLVQRQLAAEDKRCVKLALTELGEVLSNKILRHVSDQNDKIVSAIGADRARLLQEALNSVGDAVNEDNH